MRLAERRRIKQLKEEALPNFTKQFHEQTGLNLPIEVDDASFGALAEPDPDKFNSVLDWVSGYVNYGEFWTEAITAFKELVADDIGKQTMESLIKGWTIKYEKDVPKGLQLKDGILIQHVGHPDEVYARMYAQEYRDFFASQLIVDGLRMDDRRAIRQIRDEVVPKHRAELKEGTGLDIAVEVDCQFEKIADPARRTETLDWLRGVYNYGEFWTEVVEALKSVCRDDLGKEAVGENVKRLLVKWQPGRGAGLTLADGTLTYFYNFADCPSDGSYRLFRSDFQSQLERML